jgi:uncharacterized protein (DUF302 family)
MGYFPKKPKLTIAQKYKQLKAQTESAGMKVVERNGKIVVLRKKGLNNGNRHSRKQF